MTTMAPAGEGGGGSGTTATTTEQAPATTSTTTTATTTSSSAPSQHPPPSPLSGCYLLVVLPEPHTAQHKDLILNRLAKGFLSWDKDSCHVDLEKELQALVAQSPEGEEARNGERLIQYATENLVTEVLIYPQSNTLLQCIRNLLASFTKHRHIIHAGYTFGGNGSWILQDGTFSLADFLDAFSEHEVQRVLRAYENSVTVDIHCAGVGDWTTARLSKEACTRACRVRVNPDDVLTAGVPAITSFTSYIGQYLIAQTLDQLMEPSDVVGNIRFSHPTLYVFPGGQGDAALFGINGFNMLVDGGFARKACFWDFTRHLDRLDAVLVTRINNSNVGGMSSVLKKKKEMHVYPQIGHFFCNLVERRHSNSPDGDKDIDPLILNLIDIGQEMMVNLRHINLRPHPCYRDPEPINLYHKVGHGTLDMYVLSPSKDSREVREFLAKWNASDSKLFAGSHRKDSSGMVFPAQNLVSICALLVWQPANPEDTITRILFPGSTPQHKIFEGFERLKHLEFLKHPTCTAKSLSPSTSLMALKDKAAILKPKLSSIERETKRLAETRREKRDTSEIKAVKKDAADDASTRISTAKPSAPPQIKTETKARKVVENKKIESEAKESKKIEKELKETKKEVKKVEKSEQPESDAKKTDAVKVETEKTAPPAKEPKTQKIDVKKRETKEITKTTVKPSKPESMTKPSIKPIEKKPKPSGEKKDIMKPSPTTPKKSMNGAATKTEVSKTVAKSAVKTTSKISTAAPAKSAKDANNRMVVEQKNIESAAASAATKAPAKPKAIERKPISRRTKPVSPSKARLPISPAKSTRSTPTASVKSEKDAVIRKVKGGTTDSSAVSTPSGIEPESAIKLIDKNLTEKSEDISLDSIESKVLADLKEEREVVEEIEAVLQKAERIEEARKEERFEGDDEITAEATDKKEEDMTEEDVTAEMDDAPKKLSRKESQELTEEDEYLIVEKEEIYTEDSVQSGDAEQKHHLDEAESEKSRIKIGKEPEEEEEEEEAEEEDQENEKEDAEEKKDEVPEKSLVATATEGDKRKSMDLSPEHKELLKEEMKQIIASATEAIQKTEEKDDSGKKDSEDITKDPSSLSPDKLDSSVKPDIDQKETVPEKLEESQERISTLESGATTTAPTLPEDERIPLDEIKEDVDEKHVLEEVKEKEIPVKEKEVIPEALPVVSKPEVKVLDVKPPVHHGIARDVVKTPDEVADLPVHEEVDPKLYRMEELEKDKETKAPAPVQEPKEPTPTVAPVKEQKDKGMFSFFGKVADKFEKGIDKLTKKARRDSADKDAEDKSSKSSSPKESKPQEKVIFEDVDIDKVFPKVGKHEEKVESFEQVQPQVSDIKVAAIKETSAFLQEERKESIVAVTEPPIDITDKTKDEKLELQSEEKVVEDVEEVEALAEEASRKFKNVKDSLQDSLESLEDKAEEAKKSAAAATDMVKDTLVEAAEKLDDVKSDVSDLIESKEPEKVKFIIPSSDDTEKDEDDSDGIVRDFKEAVRDVAEVLMGTTGIEIEKEEKPKDVVQIVKKVAEVLKEDDFLVEKALFTDKGKEKDESPKSPAEEAMIPKKVGVTEEFAPHEEVEEILEVGVTKRLSTDYQKADGFEVHEEPCTKVQKDKDVSLTSPARDAATDKEEAMRICEDLLKDDVLVEPIAEVAMESKADVMELGLEEVCVKKVAKREVHDEQSADEKIIVESEIGFEQKLSPGKAELVTVTPGSTPTSPKLPTELELPELPTEYKNIFDKETSLENLIEEFIVVKKHKITIQIIEYIVIVKRVPKEKVINIIQKTIIKHKIPRDSVADSVQVLRSHDIPSEKRLAIENYIRNEYLNKNKRITFSVIEEISMKETIPKCVVIEIVEEIVDKQISRESVFDIPEETYFTILREIDDTTEVSTGIDEKDDDKIVEGFVNISSKDAAEAFIQKERKESHDEAKVVDDFVAVEEEHKVRDVPSSPTTEKPDAQKTKDEDEVTEHVSDVTEADEKLVKDTPEKIMREVSESDSKDISSSKVDQIQDREISEVSEEVDTNEKYLDEAKEKTTEKKDSETPIETLKETHIDTLGKSHADATGRPGGFVDVTEIEQTKDDDESQEADKESHDGIVKRMVVTASSEDGGHETEICPSGTITFTKSPTSEDSLKEVDAKSTPEKDSLMLDKDSLRSAGSTPEKDSIVSDKPDQEDDKITPEDSLEKSGTVVDILQSKEIKTDETTLKELETELDAQKFVGVADQLSSIISSTEMAKTPDSLHSGDASPAESVFSKSPTEKAFTQATELFSHENLITEKIIDDLSAIADKSKSPSVEKEAAIDASHSKADVKSKSPSLEKEIEKKDISVEASAEVKIDDRSKSPSAEKEVTQKEMSPDALKDVKIDDRSKSPSSEKEVEKKDMTPEVPAEVKVGDRSKSPSAEKEIAEKEMAPELKADAKADDRSKSPSVEKEASKKESSPEPEDIKTDDRSKSPSVEKETAEKEISPELKADAKADDRSKSPSLEKEVSKKETSHEPEDIKTADKSKSPSVEKETVDKEISPELKADIKADDRSKSPSFEKDVSKKEASQEPEDIKAADKSKSPSVEKESLKKEISAETAADDKTIDRSKSPSLEKEVAKTQVTTDDKIDDRSKSPSAEKDTIQEKTPEIVDQSKSPSLEKEIEVKIASEVADDAKVHDKSKSPSAEKEFLHKEMSPELKADVKDDDRSKSPSVEKDAKKEMSPEIQTEHKADDRSKSPSLEKELAQKEAPPALDAKTDDRSKSPSVEKERDEKESSPTLDAKADKSKSPSVEKETDKKEIFPEVVPDSKTDDRSKSPSVEKGIDMKETLLETADSTKLLLEAEKEDIEKEKSSEIVADDKTIEKSKSPSPDKDAVTEEISPSAEKDADKKEPSPEAKTEVEIKDRSKSPSVEKEEAHKETAQEVSTDIKVDDRSKSPSVETDAEKKDALSEVTADTKADDRSKSPSVEKDGAKKEMSPELPADTKVDDRSKSPSAEKDAATKEMSPEVTAVDKSQEKSKSPSLEQEVAKKEMSPELTVDDKGDDKSKSPSVEKDVSKKEASPEPTVDSEAKDRSKSPTVEKEADKKEASPGLTSDVKADDRSKSPSVEPESDKKEMSSEFTTKADDRSKSPSVEKDHIKKEMSPEVIAEAKPGDKLKSPSPEKDVAKNETSPVDSKDDRSKSPSIEKDDAKKEMSPEIEADIKVEDRSKSPSAEKVTATKEMSPELTVDLKTDDRSKSPSVEKDDSKKEMSPELVADAKSEDRSKSPSVEKDTDKKDVSSEITADAKVDDRSKSPSVEKARTKREVSPELAADEKSEDRSKSPSVEKDTDKKEVSSEITADAKVEDKSKSPSVEKDAVQKEISPEPIADAKAEDRSKSPSVEKDADKKDLSSEVTADAKVEDKSKSPSVEKDADKKDVLSEVTADAKADDRSKSPSVEKDADKKDVLSEVTADTKVDDRSKSPSVEKDADKKDVLSEATADAKADDRSKSPSVEKDADKKDLSSEVTVDVKVEEKSKSPSVERDTDKKDVLSEVTADTKADDKPKSPSVEKDAEKKDVLSDVTADVKADDKSKSPSVEKDAEKKDTLSEVTADTKADDRSKSPSVEKEVERKEMSPELIVDAKASSVEKDDKKDMSSELTSESKIDDKSKSPSVEKETDKKETSPELATDVKVDDKSKSPSVEKDADKKEMPSELSADTKTGEETKSPSPEKQDLKDDVKLDHSKSPSIGKDTDKTTGVDGITAIDKSKSPSVEKDVKESSAIDATKSLDDFKAPSVEKDEKSLLDTHADKSKSPSVEKDEKSLLDTHADKSKSPSVEKDEKSLPDTHADKSKSPSVEKDEKSLPDTHADKSKSPSVEKDEISLPDTHADKSKSPSVEKDEKSLLDTHADKSKSPSAEKDEISLLDTHADKSKSPSVEKDEKSLLDTHADQSKSPSAEKDEKSLPDSHADRSKSQSAEKDEKSLPDTHADKSKSPSAEKDEKSLLDTLADKSKSPSAEKDEKSLPDSHVDKSKSPSAEKDEKSLPDTHADKSKSPSAEKDEISLPDTHADKSKSPSVEKDEKSLPGSHADRSKSPSAEKDEKSLPDTHADKSKSPSAEKDEKSLPDTHADKSKSPSAEKDEKSLPDSHVDKPKSPSVEKDEKSLPDIHADKSKSPSVEKDSKDKESPEKLSDVVQTDDRSKSPSVEKDTSKTQVSTVAAADTKLDDRSKSPSLEKEKIESRSSIVGEKMDDFLDRKASLSSLQGDKSVEKEEPAMQRASISEDKSQKSRSPSVSGDLKSEAHDYDKSKSVSPVSEKTRADVSLLDTADDRKSSIASIESHAEEKGKDRSRSHSLFETGDKTPLVRSRAASLYEDKIVEKLGVLEHAKDPLGHAHGVFEETDELRLSQEAIDKLHAADSKEDLAHKQDVTPETRKAIEDYIFSEFVNKKKLITLSTIHEISIIYNIDESIIMRIINEIISNQKIKRETIVDFDDKEHEETSQKLLDDEEKLTNYINDEFIAKKKKIDSKTVDTIASSKSVSRHLVILVIENIISSRSLRRESIVDGDFSESHDSSQKEDSHTSTNVVSDKDSGSRKESLSESLKPSVETKSMSPSPEPSLTYKLGRPDPHIDEEITISENKRIEVESLLIDEYITRGIKITETILEQIVTKTSLPKYIIIEIIEEILIKKHLSKDAIADKSIFHDDDDDSQHKLEYEGMATPEIGERKSSGYSTPDTRHYEAGLEKGGQYSDYESPFHKAFMGGMTEIRTTHITTLSGKSTPDFGQRTETPESISEATDNAKATITSVPGQFESTTGDDSHQTSSASQSKTEETVQESVKTTEETHSQLPTGETVVVLKTTQITTYPEETTETTKEFITRERISDDDPTKKQIIEQDESETITKVIKHEVVHMTGEPVITKRTSISGGDYNQEFITRETTKTITSQEEIDPVSLFDTLGTTSSRKSVDHTESTSVSDSKAPDQPSTVSPSAINIEEKLISLDSHPSDTSKTSISSVSGHDSKAESSVVHEEKHTTFFSKDLMDHTIPEQLEQSAFPLIRDLITDDKSYSGKSSPDVSLPKDIVYGGSTGKSTPDISMSPLMRDGSMMQSHLQSGRSTPDKRSDKGSRTATPEGFRSGDVIRTIITTTRTMSDDGEIITTTQEVTEATNEKGETIVITQKTDVKVDERLPETKPIDIQRAPSASSDKEFDPTSPRSDLSSGHSRAATHMWGSSDERHTYSDEEQSSPPFSSSPYHQDSSVKEGTFKTPDDFASAAMSSSFYGELPEESIHFHTSTLSKTVQQVLPEGEPDEFSFKKFTVEKEFAGGLADKGSKKYVDEADLDFEKALTEEKSEHDRGQGSSVLGAGDFSQELEKSSDQSKAHPADDKKDPLAGWGSPLGLPSPKAPRKFNLRSPIQPCSSADLSPDSLNFDVINDWGEPMRLPSPAPTANEVSNKGSPGTPKKEKKQAKKVLSENIKNKKRSESPSKNEKRLKDSKNKVQPVYVDLTYVSHHGNSFYTALEFFKKVRARYYVFSGTEPSREVYDALLEAKKTWEDKDLEVTMIPTYDTDTLGYWVADNEEALAAHHIDLSPSASRCTINLQDHETSCSAYRLEF